MDNPKGFLQWMYLRRGLYLIGLYWFALNLPFQNSFPPTALGLMIFGLGWILRKDWLGLFNSLLANKAFLLSLLLFAWVSVGLLYSQDSRTAEREWVLKIPLIAWPLALAGMEKSFAFSRDKLLKWFVAACLLSSLLLLGKAWMNYRESGEVRFFFYHNLMSWPFVPAHYMSMFLSFSAALSFHWLLDAVSDKRRRPALLWSLPLGVFVLMIGLSGIRMQWVVLPFLLLITAFYHIRKNKKLLRPAVAVLVGGLLLMGSSPEVQRRAQETYIEWLAMRGEAEGYQTNERYYLWKHAWIIIGEHPWIGHGTGGGDPALNRSLANETAEFWNGERLQALNHRKYNLHSVYLQHLASHGVIGLLMLLSLFVYPLWQHRKNPDLQMILFLSVSALSFLTESMLQRQAGLFFFAFFYAILVVAPTRDTATLARAEKD